MVVYVNGKIIFEKLNSMDKPKTCVEFLVGGVGMGGSAKQLSCQTSPMLYVSFCFV